MYIASGSDENTLDFGGNQISYVEKGFEIYNGATNTNLNSDANNVVTFFSDDDIDFNGGGGYTGQLLVNGVLVP